MYATNVASSVGPPSPTAIPSDRTFSGFTLLEIVLALAILSGALAALGEVVRLANRNAERARDQSQAQLLASTVLAELVSGARELTQVEGESLEVDVKPRWLYSVRIEQLTIEQLQRVTVRVYQDLPPESEPAFCELIRWFPTVDSTTSSAGGSSGNASAMEEDSL